MRTAEVVKVEEQYHRHDRRYRDNKGPIRTRVLWEVRSEGVRVFGPTTHLYGAESFAQGWNAALDEISARRRLLRGEDMTLRNKFDLGDKVTAYRTRDAFPGVVIEFDAAKDQSFVVPEFEGTLQNDSSLAGWYSNSRLVERTRD